jgi:hypothetical protein
VGLVVVLLILFLLSTERSFLSSRRQQSLCSLLFRLNPLRQPSLTLARRRRVLSVHPCSMHWITGSLAKPPFLRLRMQFWIVLTQQALARLTPKSCSRSTQLVRLLKVLARLTPKSCSGSTQLVRLLKVLAQSRPKSRLLRPLRRRLHRWNRPRRLRASIRLS